MKETKSEKVYTVDDIMEILTVSRETVYNWIRSGKLTAIRLGRQYRITKDHYDKFIREHTVNNG